MSRPHQVVFTVSSQVCEVLPTGELSPTGGVEHVILNSVKCEDRADAERVRQEYLEWLKAFKPK